MYITLIPGGFLLVLKTKVFYDMIGDVGWCERFFGRGGTYTFLKLLGAFLIFLPLLISFGAFDGLAAMLGSIGLGG